MTLQELANSLAAQRDLSKTTARGIITMLLELIAQAARDGEEVSLPGFGKFKVRDTAARTARNPTTGKPVTVAASRKLVFQPAKALKDSLKPRA
jgi:DNA-binding protein HU-beta